MRRSGTVFKQTFTFFTRNWSVGTIIGSFADTGLSRKDVGITGPWILDSDFMTSAGSAVFLAAHNIEEWSSQQDLERSVVYDLDLKIYRNRTHLHWVILDKS